MQTIKIKCTLENSSAQWTQIMKLLSNFEIRPLKLVPCSGGYIAHINDIDECEKLLSEPVVEALQAVSCVPVTPPQIRAKRTIVLHAVDGHILRDTTNEQLLESLSETNAWLKIDSVFKFKNGNSFKIVCDTHAVAERCLKDGVRLSYTYIPPRNISREIFVFVSYCYRCYAMDSHMAKDCPKPGDFKVCSLCSSHNHTFKDCTAEAKKCLNCGGSHGTLSYSCPKRRDIARRINVHQDKECKEESAKSYAGAVRGSTAAAGHGTTSCDLTRSVMCVLLAGFSESQQTGTFNECLGSLLRVNNLPSLEMGTFCPPDLETFLREGLSNILSSFPKVEVGGKEFSRTSRNSRRNSLIPRLTVEPEGSSSQPSTSSRSSGRGRRGGRRGRGGNN